MRLRRGAFLAAAAAAATAAPARAATFDAQLYGRWRTSSETKTTDEKNKKVTETRTVTLLFGANNNIYYESKTTVNGKDVQRSAISGVYEVMARGTLRISFDPTMDGTTVGWTYQVNGNKLVIIDENGAPQTFVKISQ